MASITRTGMAGGPKGPASASRGPGRVLGFPRPSGWGVFARRVASNFAILGAAELLCRAISIVVALSLTSRLKPAGFGRVEFAFNVVFWLVLIVRDCFETIITREIARHPRLIRSLVNHVLAVKLLIASALLAGMVLVSLLAYSNEVERQILWLYGLLLLTTALGLDFVFRATESVGLVAVSLLVRTTIYSCGVWLWVHDASEILRVPLFLAAGEFFGIGLVWLAYSRRYGVPRPTLGLRFLAVFLRRGKAVGLIHLCQAVMISADFMVVGLLSQWSEVGYYGASHRMVTALLAFGIIYQQVMFPALARSRRAPAESGRRLLDFAVRLLVAGFLPVAVGGSLLAVPLVRLLLPPEYHDAGPLLAVGIWRAPILSLAFLYQAALIATNRERQGVRLLVWGALASSPLIAALRLGFGLPGASFAVLVIGAGVAAAGYVFLSREGRAPAVHHHLGRPLLACLVMAPVALLAARTHALAAVVAGALAYAGTLYALGGFRLGFPEACPGFRPSAVEAGGRAGETTAEIELAGIAESW